MKHIAVYALSAILLTGCIPQNSTEAMQAPQTALNSRQMQTRRFDTTDYQAILNASGAVLQDLGFTIEESEMNLGVLVGSKTRDATSGAQVAGALVIALLGGGSTPVDSLQVIRVSLVMRELDTPQKEQPEPAEPTKLTAEKIAHIKTSVNKAVKDGLKAQFKDEISTRVADKIAEDTAKTLAGDLTTLAQVKAEAGSSTVRVTFQRVIIDTRGNVTKSEQIIEPEVYQGFFDKLSQSVFLEAHEL